MHLAPTVGTNPLAIEATRLKLANVILRLADADGRKLSNYVERVLSAHADVALSKDKTDRPQRR